MEWNLKEARIKEFILLHGKLLIVHFSLSQEFLHLISPIAKVLNRAMCIVCLSCSLLFCSGV